MKQRIVTVADTTLGYGSPQILRLTSSICELFDGDAIVFHPLLASRPAVPVEQPHCTIETIPVASHAHSFIGRWEYVERCADYINTHKPDILIFSNYSLFGLLDRLSYTPAKIIHLALEGMDLIGPPLLRKAIIEKIKLRASRINYWIFPETTRAIHDVQLLKIPAERVCVMYNTFDNSTANAFSRNSRMLYAGTLDADSSIGKYIFEPGMAHLPIDVFGDLQGSNKSKQKMRRDIQALKASPRKTQLRWYGQISGSDLSQTLPLYNYSIIFWLPTCFSFLNAAPNKFFQAVAAGVPVISAPHPQTKMLIERYGCGIILDGWEKSDIVAGLHQALKLMGSSQYEEMVKNCSRALQIELSWDKQFSKLVQVFNKKSLYDVGTGL